jgi:transcriptional regulator with XRE-family HTH domain
MTVRPGTGFGARLRAVRKRRGLAQKDLAGPGVSMSYVSRLESGDRTPSSQVVQRLAAVLEVDPSELVGDELAITQDRALAWCEGLIAYHDGDLDRAVDLLALLGPRSNGELFGWCVEWTRVVLQSRLPDGRALLRAADRLRAGWSPGPVVDAFVEIQRANALHQLGRSTEAVHAAQAALDLVGDDGGERGRRVRTRALIALCTELLGAGRVTDAERVADVLGEHVGELGGDRLAIAAWWVRAKVFDRLGNRARATACIDRAHDLLDGFKGDPVFRCRVRLAWAAIGLRNGEPDLDRIAAELDEVEATTVARPSEVAAHAMALRAEVALRFGEVDRCRQLAERALATDALGQEDRLRCALLLVRAADEVDDAEFRAAARAVLGALLDKISPETVDPVLWRDVARIALRRH